MAFERSFIRTVRFVSTLDPAIDRDHPDLASLVEEYRKTGDVAKLPLREGATPTVFEIAPMSRKQLTRVLGIPSDKYIEQCSEAVAYGLRSVSNFIVDGEQVVIEHATVSDEKRVKPAVLDRIFDPLLFAELGARILELNRLNPTSG